MTRTGCGFQRFSSSTRTCNWSRAESTYPETGRTSASSWTLRQTAGDGCSCSGAQRSARQRMGNLRRRSQPGTTSSVSTTLRAWERFAFVATRTHRFSMTRKDRAAPPIARVQELQAVSLKLEGAHAEEHPDYEKWLAQPVVPGSSLGGARPKAGVIDEEGHLCIAKFPSRKDTHDVGAWEFVVHRLAAAAGIEVSPAKLRRFGDEGHTYISRRFDRTETGGRKHSCPR